MKEYYIYILSSNTETLYIGVTSNIVKRIYEHKNNLVDGFSKKYSCHKLVYYEIHSDINEAIKREKQLKKWKREWKINLIDSCLHRNDRENLEKINFFAGINKIKVLLREHY